MTWLASRHRRVLAVGLIGLFGWFGSFGASTSQASARAGTTEQKSKASQRATTVQLRSINVRGATRTYVATVLDDQGDFIPNADLDLGALGTDPDLRVTTTPMRLSATDKSYNVTVTFPENGDWVIVVRVHAPTQLVELFTEAITGSTSSDDSHGSSTFSRAALLRADPTFFDRYSPTKSISADLHSSSEGVTIAEPFHSPQIDTSARLDPVALGATLMHTGGAVAWLLAILGLVVANRVGPGVARHQLIGLVWSRYRLFAGGGLVVVMATGLINVDKNSPGLLRANELVTSNLGITYLAIFGFKMAVVVASIVTTYRIDQLLAHGAPLPVTSGSSFSGAFLNSHVKVMELAERNALFGGAILVSVALLSQIHRLLH
jgi:hypothetical protein